MSKVCFFREVRHEEKGLTSLHDVFNLSSTNQLRKDTVSVINRDVISEK